MAIASPTLSDEQNAVKNGIITNITKKVLVLKASAGTGKSTVIAAIERELGEKVLILCPTHRAEIQLMMSGVKNTRQIAGMFKNPQTQDAFLKKDLSLLVVDEASMVDHDDKSRLISLFGAGSKHNITILFVGDPRQLPPVRRHGRLVDFDWFVAEKPDFILSKVYRQADKFKIEVVADAAINPDIPVIVMTNKTRNHYNISAHEVRHGKLGAYTNKRKTHLKLSPGDKLVCHKTDNNRTYRNNCVYEIASIKPHKSDDKKKLSDEYEIKFVGASKQPIFISKELFRADGYLNPDQEKRKWELAYALTCHAAQGSGFDHVHVMIEREQKELNDTVQWVYPLRDGDDDIDMARWLYTAITRGKKSVIVVDPTGAIEADGLSLDITIQTDFGQDAEVKASDDLASIKQQQTIVAFRKPTVPVDEQNLDDEFFGMCDDLNPVALSASERQAIDPKHVKIVTDFLSTWDGERASIFRAQVEIRCSNSAYSMEDCSKIVRRMEDAKLFGSDGEYIWNIKTDTQQAKAA